MKTFKRPMFRKGGNVGNGIMTGITDRVEAQNGFLPGSTAERKGAMGVTEEGIELANPIPKVSAFTPMTYENIDIEEMVGTPKSTAEYIEELKAGAGEYGGMDPLTSFLLTAGPSVAGAKNFADAIQRLKPGTDQLLKDAAAKAKYDRDLRLAGVKLGIGAQERADQQTFDLKKLDLSQENQVKFLNDQRAYERLQTQDKRDYDEVIADRARAFAKLDKQQQKEYEERLIKEGRAFELQQIKRKEKFELDKIESQQKFQEKLLDKQLEKEQQFTVKDFADTYKGSRNQANNRVKFENENIEAKIVEKFGDKNYGGLIGGETHGRTDRKLKNAKDRDLNKVYFDVMDGKVKRLRKTKEGEYKFEIIEDIDTFVEPEAPPVKSKEEKDAEISERFEYLNPRQREFLENLRKKTDDTPSA